MLAELDAIRYVDPGVGFDGEAEGRTRTVDPARLGSTVNAFAKAKTVPELSSRALLLDMVVTHLAESASMKCWEDYPVFARI